MAHPISVVDAFTDAPFAGNPAAVCILDQPTTEAWMQAVAAELNLAMTAFAAPRSDGDGGGDGELDLRWFTPTTEVPLCGHATLATAHVLGLPEARFHTRSGVLTCTRGDDGAIEMDFPAIRTEPVADPPGWASALGLEPEQLVEARRSSEGWWLVVLADAAAVRAVAPDQAAIAQLGSGTNAVVAPGDRPGIDSVCRVFAPGFGVPEDPVTGSAHCMIAPWLAGRVGGSSFTGEQASARGGIVGMRLAGERVPLTGKAVTVIEGNLQSDPPVA